MAVRTEQNQFLGVNPYLHSYWQAENKWNRFHGLFIAQLLFDIKKRLIRMGYSAETGESLQIRRYGDVPYRPQADVIIRDTYPLRFQNPATPVMERSVSLAELEGEMNTETPFQSIAIYEFKNYEHGELVAWIEVLSPTNKTKIVDAIAYQGKRRVLLQQGIVFVEIDLMHETPPTFARIPDYTAWEKGATPYRIILLDPRPSFQNTQALLEGFSVDMPLPTLDIPLNADDHLTVDFDRVYNELFMAASFGFDMAYDQFPVNLHTYSPDDQARIATRMLYVLETPQENLDHLPTPLATLPLEEAIRRLALLGSKA